MPVASAQVKTAIILAGLYADGETVIHEIEKSRDHTELMLSAMGADLTVDNLDITVKTHKRPLRQLMLIFRAIFLQPPSFWYLVQLCRTRKLQ